MFKVLLIFAKVFTYVSFQKAYTMETTYHLRTNQVATKAIFKFLLLFLLIGTPIPNGFTAESIKSTESVIPVKPVENKTPVESSSQPVITSDNVSPLSSPTMETQTSTKTQSQSLVSTNTTVASGSNVYRQIKTLITNDLVMSFGLARTTVDDAIKNGTIAITVSSNYQTATVSIASGVQIISGDDTINFSDLMGKNQLAATLQYTLMIQSQTKNSTIYAIATSQFSIGSTYYWMDYRPSGTTVPDNRVHRSEIHNGSLTGPLIKTMDYSYPVSLPNTINVHTVYPLGEISLRDVVIAKMADDKYHFQSVTDFDDEGNFLVRNGFIYNTIPGCSTCLPTLQLASIRRLDASGGLISEINLTSSPAVLNLSTGEHTEIVYTTLDNLLEQALLFENKAAFLARLAAENKLVNYYPSASGQANMWLNWNPVQIEADFQNMANGGVQSVRIAVWSSAFGYPQPMTTMLGHLSELMEIAERTGVKVKLVFFAGFTNFADIEGSKTHMAGILNTLALHLNQVSSFVLFNEGNTNDPVFMNWGRQLVPYIQGMTDFKIPITISLTGTNAAKWLDLVANVDRLKNSGIPITFYEIHYYGASQLAFSIFKQVKDVVAGTAPIYIGETGAFTDYTGLSTPYSSTWWLYNQDYYLRGIEFAAQAAGLPNAAIWLWKDLINVYPTPADNSYGIYFADGTPKPAAQSIGNIFAGQPIDVSFNNGFETFDGTNQPVIWKRWDQAYGTFSIDTTTAHSGNSSVKISNTTINAAKNPSYYVAPILSIVPGETVITVSAWAKGMNIGGTNRISLAWFDASGRYLTTNSSSSLPAGTTSWTQLTVSAVAPANAAYVEVHLVSANNPGTVWYDDVTLSQTTV